MPRPNPPRKRPRRRNPNVVKVPEQTAEDGAATTAQPAEQQRPQPRLSRTAAALDRQPAPLDTSEWKRTSLFVMVGLMALAWLLIRLLTYTFSKSTASVALYVLFFEPFTLVASGFVAMPIAKRLTQEHRYLRLVETAMVGVYVFFISIFFQAGVGALLQTTGNIVSVAPQLNPVPTACAANDTTCSTVPTPTQSATPRPTPSPRASSSASASKPNASPSPSPAPTVTVRENATSYSILSAADLLSFGLTPLVFYPVYRRLRFKPRVPPPPRDRNRR
jgi:outer membrane biosynthesis protein TonB